MKKPVSNEKHQQRMVKVKQQIDKKIAKADKEQGVSVLLTGNGKRTWCSNCAATKPYAECRAGKVTGRQNTNNQNRVLTQNISMELREGRREQQASVP